MADPSSWTPNSKNRSCYFNRGIDTVKITALSNQKPEILNNYIRIDSYSRVFNNLYWWHPSYDTEIYGICKCIGMSCIVPDYISFIYRIRLCFRIAIGITVFHLNISGCQSRYCCHKYLIDIRKYATHCIMQIQWH